MPRYKLLIEYDGYAFYGWQRQKGQASVQETIEQAIEVMSKEPVRLVAAGRTDAGVHAKGQVAHFDSTTQLSPSRLRECINNNVGHKPVSVLDVSSVEPTFHARRSAKARHYMYRIINRVPNLTLDRGLALHVRYKLDVESIRNATKLLLGTHDFSSFRGARCQSLSPVKTMISIEIQQHADEVCIHFTGSSFLHHQIRNMIGTLLMVGQNKITVNEFENIMLAKNRSKAGPTAPPCGLYFVEVLY